MEEKKVKIVKEGVEKTIPETNLNKYLSIGWVVKPNDNFSRFVEK